jgi:DNA-binding response OmpR family regulator
MGESEATNAKRGSRVLVVDDDPHHNKIVADLLEHEGYDVRTALSTKSAVSAHWEFRPHIVILDIMMPQLDGYSACDVFRQVHPELPIVMLSAKDRTEDIQEAVDWGADFYLTKPFDPDELLAVVERLLAEKPTDENIDDDE